MDDLLHPATAKRLARARQGEDVARRLRIASLEPGQVGVLQAEVVHVHAPRTFQRRNGTEGLVGRVMLRDGTGEVDLVLWDDENRHVRDGTLEPGRLLRLRGVQVKAGYRGGVELALGPALLEPVETTTAHTRHARIVDLPDTQVVDGRFQVQATVALDGAPVLVVAWDADVKALRDAGIGATVELDMAPHPLLEGVYLVSSVGMAQTKTDAANSQPPTTSET